MEIFAAYDWKPFQSCYFHFYSYITLLDENSPEGSPLKFVGGFDRVQDFDKVSSAAMLLFYLWTIIIHTVHV
jgi:hypothetical protein